MKKEYKIICCMLGIIIVLLIYLAYQNHEISKYVRKTYSASDLIERQVDSIRSRIQNPIQ